MPHKQANLDRQLTHAKEQLDVLRTALDKRDASSADRRRDPLWRELSARCSHLRARIHAAAAIVARDEEVKLRKTQEKPKVKAADKGKGKGKGKETGKKKGGKKEGGKKDKSGGKGGKKK